MVKDILTLVSLDGAPPMTGDEATDENEADNEAGERLLDATKKLCASLSDLLRFAEPECAESRQNLFVVLGQLGEAGNQIVRAAASSAQTNSNNNAAHYDDDDDDDEQEEQQSGDGGGGGNSSLLMSHDEACEQQMLQETFMGLAKMVASATASLVIASKAVANQCESQHGVNEVIAQVTQCALSTSQLVACTKVCAPTIASRECQAQIDEAARQVARRVVLVSEVAALHCRNAAALGELARCGSSVREAVEQLLETVQACDERLIASSASNRATQATSNINNNNNNTMSGLAANSSLSYTSSYSTIRAASASDMTSTAVANKHTMNTNANACAEYVERIQQVIRTMTESSDCVENGNETVRHAKVLAQVRLILQFKTHMTFCLTTTNKHFNYLSYRTFLRKQTIKK